MIIFNLLLLVAIIVVWAFVALTFQDIAGEKGYYEKKYFWWTFLFGIVGCLMVVALPDKSASTRPTPPSIDGSGKKPTTDLAYEERLLSNGGWKCPSCQKVNPESVTTCRCGMTKC